jgi:hypothetical protein
VTPPSDSRDEDPDIEQPETEAEDADDEIESDVLSKGGQGSGESEDMDAGDRDSVNSVFDSSCGRSRSEGVCVRGCGCIVPRFTNCSIENCLRFEGWVFPICVNIGDTGESISEVARVFAIAGSIFEMIIPENWWGWRRLEDRRPSHAGDILR